MLTELEEATNLEVAEAQRVAGEPSDYIEVPRSLEEEMKAEMMKPQRGIQCQTT